VSYRANTLSPAQAVGGSIGDFVALMKPRVMSLVVFTALVGMLLAPVQPHRHRRHRADLHRRGAGLGALNMRYDADIDARCMHGRPASGAGIVTPDEASPSGPSWLSARSPPRPHRQLGGRALLAFTIAFYVLVIRCGQSGARRRTSSSASLGAFPLMIGWAAVTLDGTESVALFPSSSCGRRCISGPRSIGRDYARAGVPDARGWAGRDAFRSSSIRRCSCPLQFALHHSRRRALRLSP
jgi:heme O synthase-like polyprenyltransferase